MRERGGKYHIKTVWAIPPDLGREGSTGLSVQKEQIFPKGYSHPAFFSPSYFLISGRKALGFN